MDTRHDTQASIKLDRQFGGLADQPEPGRLVDVDEADNRPAIAKMQSWNRFYQPTTTHDSPPIRLTSFIQVRRTSPYLLACIQSSPSTPVKICLGCTFLQVAATSTLLLSSTLAESVPHPIWDPVKSRWTGVTPLVDAEPSGQTEEPSVAPGTSDARSPSIGHAYIPEPGAALLGGIGILILLRRWRGA